MTIKRLFFNKKKSSFILWVFFVSVYLVPSYADIDSENAALARLVHEIEALNPLINDAEKQQPKNTRIYFNYEALRHDLNQIKAGINQQITSTAIEPRAVEPIQGDYTTVEHLTP